MRRVMVTKGNKIQFPKWGHYLAPNSIIPFKQKWHDQRTYTKFKINWSANMIRNQNFS